MNKISDKRQNTALVVVGAFFRCAKNLLLKKPILVIFDTTKLCNQRCPMCNIRKNTSVQMSLEEIAHAADELKKFGVSYAFVQGGEPLLRKDIVDIVDIFISRSIKPTVITNGVFLTYELAEQLADRHCNLTLSIDSLEREKYAYLRGSDDLPTVLENIEKLSAIPHLGNWAITSTITKQSEIGDIINIYEYAKEHGFMFAIRPYIAVTGTAGRKDENLTYEPDEVLDIFDHFIAIAKRENYLAYLVYREHVKYIKGEPVPPCDAMKFSFLLKEDGSMAPCLEMPENTFLLSDFSAEKKRLRNCIETCNEEHPCFYNDAREIGILYRNILKILFNLHKIISQMIRYKNFF